MKIKLDWQYAKGELDTDTLELLCLPARGKRSFGADEMDAELCIKDGWNFTIADIHLGDVESSNILCKEIAKRWNEFKELEANQSQWISVNDAIPKDSAEGICKVKFVDDSIDEMTMRKVSKWVFPYTKGKYVTHWKPIAKPKEVKE